MKQNCENQLTIENVLPKNYFENGFSVVKTQKGGNNVPQKKMKLAVVESLEIIIKRHKILTKDQINVFKSKLFHKTKIYDHGLSPLLMQNSYSKLIWQ